MQGFQVCQLLKLGKLSLLLWQNLCCWGLATIHILSALLPQSLSGACCAHPRSHACTSSIQGTWSTRPPAPAQYGLILRCVLLRHTTSKRATNSLRKLPAVKVLTGDQLDSNWKPPKGYDGTPNESTQDVLTRMRQVMSVTETQYSGEDIVFIAPDSDTLSVLQVGVEASCCCTLCTTLPHSLAAYLRRVTS